MGPLMGLFWVPLATLATSVDPGIEQLNGSHMPRRSGSTWVNQGYLESTLGSLMYVQEYIVATV
jgi:hypothetical protein